jgi:nitroreductase
MNSIDTLKERRSITFFDSSRTVSRDQLEELLEVANLSPSSYNLQPWEVIVVQRPERRRVLRECAFGQAKVEEAPAVFIIVADPEGIEKNIDDVLKRQVELGYITEDKVESTRKMNLEKNGEVDSEKRRIFAVKNTSLFAMSIMVAARGLGLETHPMDGFSPKKVREAFSISEMKVIPMLIAVGYPDPDRELLPRAFRRDLDSFVRWE